MIFPRRAGVPVIRIPDGDAPPWFGKQETGTRGTEAKALRQVSGEREWRSAAGPEWPIGGVCCSERGADRRRTREPYRHVRLERRNRSGRVVGCDTHRTRIGCVALADVVVMATQQELRNDQRNGYECAHTPKRQAARRVHE